MREKDFKYKSTPEKLKVQKLAKILNSWEIKEKKFFEYFRPEMPKVEYWGWFFHEPILGLGLEIDKDSKTALFYDQTHSIFIKNLRLITADSKLQTIGLHGLKDRVVLIKHSPSEYEVNYFLKSNNFTPSFNWEIRALMDIQGRNLV